MECGVVGGGPPFLASHNGSLTGIFIFFSSFESARTFELQELCFSFSKLGVYKSLIFER
jgi:hypothetical protein